MRSRSVLTLVLTAFVLAACVPGQAVTDGALGVPTPTVAAAATATPTPSPTTPPTPSPSPSAAASASPSAAPSVSPSPSASPAKSPEPTEKPTLAPSDTPTAAPTVARTEAPTASPSPTPTRSPSPPPSPSPTATGNLAIQPTPVPGSTIGSYGKVTDSITGAPLGGICVTLGQPGAICWAITDINGNYAIDGNNVVQPGGTFQMYFFTCRVGVVSLDHRTCDPTPGYPTQATDPFVLTSTIRKDWAAHH
jgi:hypothetical protein